jgi:predicted transposase YdaD
MDENREYKASVFSLLFGDPVILRELYGALEGTPLPPDVPITINTLEGALYRDRLNDLSFTVGEKLVVLIEHQSTINPNMPLRILMYIARVYEKLVQTKDVYAKGLIKIPRPELIILYNGPDTDWDTMELKLSDAFEDVSALGIDSATLPPLELTVVMYNINQGHNKAMLEKSETLNGYSVFIDKIRKYDEELDDLAAAIKKAVEYCIDRNILKQFLELHSSEVINMLFTEWKEEEALEYRYEEGRNEGRNEGKNEDIKNLLAYGMTAGQVSKALKLPLDKVAQYQENK